MIEFFREGDEVVVYSIDRLLRNLRDLLFLRVAELQDSCKVKKHCIINAL